MRPGSLGGKQTRQCEQVEIQYAMDLLTEMEKKTTVSKEM